jgi:hypothetical protein
VAVAKNGTDGIVTLKLPAFDRDARKFLRAFTTVLITKYVFLAYVLRAWRMLPKEI